MLKDEIKILKKYHVDAQSRRMQWEALYGKPFDQGNANRLAFWGTQRSSLPLHFYVASILLTAPVASTDNERAHSVSGRIVSKTRCSLVGESVDRNTTGYIWLRKRAAALAQSLLVEGLNQDDLDDLDDPHDQRLLGVLGVLEEEKEIIGEEINEGEEEEKIIELVDDQGAVGGAGAAGVGGGGGGGAAARGGGKGMVEED